MIKVSQLTISVTFPHRAATTCVLLLPWIESTLGHWLSEHCLELRYIVCKLIASKGRCNFVRSGAIEFE